MLTPSMGVVIQEMIEPEFAGVCFTEGPTPQTQTLTIVESTNGCGDSLVSGENTPSHYQIDRSGQISTCIEQVGKPSQELIKEVAMTSRRIADHFSSPQDVEWAFADGQLFILQARPITVIGSGNNKKQSKYALTSNIVGFEVSSPFISMRDQLYEWAITQTDPMLLRGSYHLLVSQNDDGCWRLEGHPEWDTVGTAMIIQLLIEGGVSPSLTWSLPHPRTNSVSLGIPAAIKWLIQNVKDGPPLGSDIWDTCQVVRSLLRCGIRPDEPMVRRPIEFVMREISSGSEDTNRQEWSGAGVLAVALQMFHELDAKEEMKSCVRLLLSIQSPDGDFSRPNMKENQIQVPSEWHTAQVISALVQSPRDVDVSKAITQACRWLENRQNVTGYWGVEDPPYSVYNCFFTAYAVIALSDAGVDRAKSINKACKWLKGQQNARGDFGDLASSLMALTAFQKVYGPMFTLKLPLPLFLTIQSTLSTSEINRLEFL